VNNLRTISELEEIIYPTPESIIAAHNAVVEQYGGKAGILFETKARLEAALGRMQSGMMEQEFYPSIVEKAAVLAHSIITSHPFPDGNKRTAFIAAAEFLHDNGFAIGDSQKFAEEVLAVAAGESSYENLLEVVRNQTKELRDHYEKALRRLSFEEPELLTLLAKSPVLQKISFVDEPTKEEWMKDPSVLIGYVIGWTGRKKYTKYITGLDPDDSNKVTGPPSVDEDGRTIGYKFGFFDGNTKLSIISVDSIVEWRGIPDKTSAQESYTDGSDIDQTKEEFDDRALEFHQEDHLDVDNERDWIWGETDYHDFPSTKIYQDIDEEQGYANRARASLKQLSFEEPPTSIEDGDKAKKVRSFVELPVDTKTMFAETKIDDVWKIIDSEASEDKFIRFVDIAPISYVYLSRVDDRAPFFQTFFYSPEDPIPPHLANKTFQLMSKVQSNLGLEAFTEPFSLINPDDIPFGYFSGLLLTTEGISYDQMVRILGSEAKENDTGLSGVLEWGLQIEDFLINISSVNIKYLDVEDEYDFDGIRRVCNSWTVWIADKYISKGSLPKIVNLLKSIFGPTSFPYYNKQYASHKLSFEDPGDPKFTYDQDVIFDLSDLSAFTDFINSFDQFETLWPEELLLIRGGPIAVVKDVIPLGEGEYYYKVKFRDPEVRRIFRDKFYVNDVELDLEEGYLKSAEGTTAGVVLPHGEEYPDYDLSLDVQPEEFVQHSPTVRKEKEDPVKYRHDRTDEETFFERGLHQTVDRVENQRPVVPYGGLKFSFERPFDPEDDEAEYEFDELPEDYQHRLLDKHRDINVDDREWWQWTYGEWKEKLNRMGFEDVDISFSGFWSQGDGASFTASSIDVPVAIKALGLFNQYRGLYAFLKRNGGVLGRVTRNSSHYVHSNTISVGLEEEYWVPEKYSALIGDLESVLQERVRNISNEIYKDLEKEHDYLTSDEQVRETLVANDYKFMPNLEIVGSLKFAFVDEPNIGQVIFPSRLPELAGPKQVWESSNGLFHVLGPNAKFLGFEIINDVQYAVFSNGILTNDIRQLSKSFFSDLFYFPFGKSYTFVGTYKDSPAEVLTKQSSIEITYDDSDIGESLKYSFQDEPYPGQVVPWEKLVDYVGPNQVWEGPEPDQGYYITGPQTEFVKIIPELWHDGTPYIKVTQGVYTSYVEPTKFLRHLYFAKEDPPGGYVFIGTYKDSPTEVMEKTSSNTYWQSPYYSILDIVEGKRKGKTKRRLDDRTYLEVTRNESEDYIELVYHSTSIITFYPDYLELMAGGWWRSVSTKARINEWLGKVLESGHIFTEKGVPYYIKYGDDFNWDNYLRYPVVDGFQLDYDGNPLNATPERKIRGKRKRRKVRDENQINIPFESSEEVISKLAVEDTPEIEFDNNFILKESFEDEPEVGKRYKYKYKPGGEYDRVVDVVGKVGDFKKDRKYEDIWYRLYKYFEDGDIVVVYHDPGTYFRYGVIGIELFMNNFQRIGRFLGQESL